MRGMNTLARVTVLLLLAVLVRFDAPAMAQDVSEAQASACAKCHGDPELQKADTQHLYITTDHFVGDVHWQKGLRCKDCHGGNAETLDAREAHLIKDGFRPLESPADIVPFCGRCHPESLKSYAQSVHGLGLSESGLLVTAVCTNCHGSHGIFAADQPQSKLHVSQVATDLFPMPPLYPRTAAAERARQRPRHRSAERSGRTRRRWQTNSQLHRLSRGT